jgi:hypothetical protein
MGGRSDWLVVGLIGRALVYWSRGVVWPACQPLREPFQHTHTHTHTHTHNTGHANFISAVRFLPPSSSSSPPQILTASGDGTLGLWDAATCSSLGMGAVDPSAEKEEGEGGEREGGGGVAKAVPLSLAVTGDGSAAAASLLGREGVRVFSLPALAVAQTLATPSAPLGVDIAGAGEEGAGDLLFASVAAPEYLLVFQRQSPDGLFAPLAEHPAALAVRAFAAAGKVGTEVVHAAEDEGLLGGMTKETLAVRHTWNDRKRKEGAKEKQRERGKRRRAKGGEGGGGGEEEGGQEGEGMAVEA